MKNIGILAKKANNIKIGKLNLIIIKDILINELLYNKKIILINKGREARMVYIIK